MINTNRQLNKKQQKLSVWLKLLRVQLLRSLFLILFLTVFSFDSVIYAQDAGPAAAGKKEKKKTLSFEDELVEGATQKPELFYLFQKKNFNYKRLIKLRENFLPEMKQTSEDLQRARSSN